MSRLPRFTLPGQPQHIIQRGNNRSAIFRADADYQFYLEKLQLACEAHGCALHAYVLMTNHVHFLITPLTGQSLPKAMQMLGRYYVQYYNFRYQRTGTLWEGRYRAALIDSEAYLFTCMRYIELNPVRAGIAVHPSAYAWSSYHCNALGRPDAVVTPHGEYHSLGKTGQERQAAYRQLFKQHVPEKTVTEIRQATNKAWVLGQTPFKQRMQKHLQRGVEPAPRGGDRKSAKFKINRV